MRTLNKTSRLLIALTLLASMIVGLSTVSAQEPKILRVAMGSAGTNVVFDPSLATDTTSHTFINMLYPGLAPRDETTGTPQHGMAEEWTISDDLMTYTFKIKEGVPWVVYDPAAGAVVEVTDEAGNVRYVNAHDFVYSVKRTIAPETAADYAYVIANWVAGGNEYNAGTGSVDDVGIRAIDDYTLEIVSPNPAGFLLQIYGEWLANAQPQWAIEEYGDAWTLPGNYPAYGTFVLKTYEPGSSVEIVRNPFWQGTESHPVSALDEIHAVFLDASAALAAYEAGELDTIEEFPPLDFARLKVERPDELYVGPGSCTYYYGFNVEKAPADNVHMRRALSAAIDRQVITDAILGRGEVPAGFFERPNYAASATQEEFPELGAHSDPEVAREELALYFEETGYTLETMPPLTLMFNTSEAHALIAQAVQQMWVETLGIEAQVTNQEWQTYLETLEHDAPPVWRLGWCEDYQDPHNFLGDVMYSTSGNNDTNWSSDEFDSLVDQAQVMTDFEARKELYARAEHILTWEDAAMAPIYFYVNSSMIGTHLKASPSVLGTERYDKWDIIG